MQCLAGRWPPRPARRRGPPPSPRSMGNEVHGGDAVTVARALDVHPSSILDLSASLNPLAPPVEALAAARLAPPPPPPPRAPPAGPGAPPRLDTRSRYPDDAERADATALMARAIGV